SPSFSWDDPRLTLFDSSSRIVLLDRELADPDRPLHDRTWTLNAFIEGPGAFSLEVAQPTTLEFGSDGSVMIRTPCATGSGTSILHATRITLSGITIGEPICPDAEFSGRIDESVRFVLA